MQDGILVVAVVLLSLMTYSDPQNTRPSQFTPALQEPSISESLELANYLFTRPLGPRGIRRDCRFLNETEWNQYIGAVHRAKADTRISPNVYDAFAFLHSHPRVNAVAHGSPVFLSFHRVLLYLYEKLLRIYEPELTLCYWDTTMESETPARSSSWTRDLFGTSQGQVIQGLGRDWNTPAGILTRQVGSRGRTIHSDDVRIVLRQRNLGDIAFPNGHASANVEEIHNHVHAWVGGLMAAIETAAYDPIFWPHHTWVDCLFEQFRENQRQNGIDPQNDWPVDYGQEDHGPFHSMRLGRLLNMDGHNDFFSRRVVNCELPPEMCRRNSDCGRLMICDSATNRCTSTTEAPFEVGPMNGMFNNFQNFMSNFNNIFGLGGNAGLTQFPSQSPTPFGGAFGGTPGGIGFPGGAGGFPGGFPG